MKKRNVLLFPLSLMCLGVLASCQSKDNVVVGDQVASVKEEVITKLDEAFKIPDKLRSVSEFKGEEIANQARHNISAITSTVGYSELFNDFSKLCPGSLENIATKRAIHKKISNSVYTNGAWEQKVESNREFKNGKYTKSLNDIYNKLYFYQEDTTNVCNPYLYYTYTRDGYQGQKLDGFRTQSDFDNNNYFFDKGITSESVYLSLLKSFCLKVVGSYYLGSDGITAEYSVDETGKNVYIESSMDLGYETYPNPIYPDKPIYAKGVTEMVGKFQYINDGWYITNYSVRERYYTEKDIKGEELTTPIDLYYNGYTTSPSYGSAKSYGKLPHYDESKSLSEMDVYLDAYVPEEGKSAYYTSNDEVTGTTFTGNSYNHRGLYDSTFYARALDESFNGYSYTANQEKPIDSLNPYPVIDDSNPYIDDDELDSTSFYKRTDPYIFLDKNVLYKINNVTSNASGEEVITTLADFENFKDHQEEDDPLHHVKEVTIGSDHFFQVDTSGMYFVNVLTDTSKVKSGTRLDISLFEEYPYPSSDVYYEKISCTTSGCSLDTTFNNDLTNHAVYGSLYNSGSSIDVSDVIALKFNAEDSKTIANVTCSINGTTITPTNYSLDSGKIMYVTVSKSVATGFASDRTITFNVNAA